MRQDLRIVVEGMDGSGKTTLINNLKYGMDDVQLEIVRNPHDDKQDFNTWWPEVADRPKSSIVPIHDRFFFSEIVYGPVLRGKINATEPLITNISFFLRSTALLIYARPHSDILRESVKDKPQMAGVLDNFESLLGLYDNLMIVEQSWFKDRFIRYDWNNPDSYKEVETRVRDYLNGKLG